MFRPVGDQPGRPYQCRNSLSFRERVRGMYTEMYAPMLWKWCLQGVPTFAGKKCTLKCALPVDSTGSAGFSRKKITLRICSQPLGMAFHRQAQK